MGLLTILPFWTRPKPEHLPQFPAHGTEAACKSDKPVKAACERHQMRVTVSFSPKAGMIL